MTFPSIARCWLPDISVSVCLIPASKTGFKSYGVKQAEDPAKGVFRGYAGG